MASGKSTVGPRLAEALGYVFLDLDEVIEERVGMSIPALFERRGEATFRQVEAAMLRATTERERIVVALGGGALTREDNLRWALRHGTVVYLRVPVEVLADRLQASGTGRPLLLDEQGAPLDEDALRTRIRTMLDRRDPYYRQADVVVAAHPPADAVTEAVLRSLRQHE